MARVVGGRRAAAVLGAALCVAAGCASVGGSAASGGNPFPVPPGHLTANGRVLRPAGRLTTTGDFPTGGALSPDGRFYWVVDSGHGRNDVQVVRVADGTVTQTVALPGGYGGVAFDRTGRRVYVSGEPRGSTVPAGPTRGDGGDVLHVFDVDPASGQAKEAAPLQLPPTAGGTAQRLTGGGGGWPEGLAVTPDGRRVVVALNQADEVAVVDTATGASRLVRVGRYPYGAAISRDGRTAYVSNEYDGTVSFVDVDSAAVTATVAVGGPDGDLNSHPEGLVADPRADRLYVAVTNRDLVTVVDTARRAVVSRVSVGRREGLGSAPVALALAPDGSRLYSADSGEDAVAVIGLHGGGGGGGGGVPRLIGRVPTAAYTSDVQVTPDGRTLLWLAAKGFGAGPNPNYGEHFADSASAPYGSYVVDKLVGRVGRTPVPGPVTLVALSALADAQLRPANARPAPRGTPVVGPGGGPSTRIKHVFYVVRENRTYDQVFGTDRRGDGDPTLELLDDNGVAGPAGGVTPNAHRLARMFPLLDHVFADSEVSKDGHIVTSSGYATDFVQKSLHAAYAGRGRRDGTGYAPVSFPPRDFLFDQAAAQGISFRNYGENSAGTSPLSDDGRPTYKASVAAQDFSYPGRFGCDLTPYQVPRNCNTDSGVMGAGGVPAGSRFDHYKAQFAQQVATDTVPALTYLTMPNDHTNGIAPGKPTPRALVADNDYGLGQLVDLVSHSPVWSSSAIFVVEDDSQDGADHVDAHRMPAFVISPWARHGAVVHTHYDQESVLRTMELILGMRPLSLFDALATPMYDAFATNPDPTPYGAVRPEQSLTQLNPPTGPRTNPVDAALPMDQLDATPQELSDAMLWRSVYGPSATPPPPGPNASSDERARAGIVLAAVHAGRDVRAALADAPLSRALRPGRTAP